MLTSGNFYWGTIRKCIVAFGNMFNNIEIDRRNSAGNVVQAIRVPLAYAPRQKFLARIEQLPDPETTSIQITLPRMSFELVKISYDPTRKLALTQKNVATNSYNNTLTRQYTPVPYNININLYIYVKNSDDGLQIIEQILPFFNPDFNLTIRAVPSMGINHDVPIILDDVSFSDNYDGDFSDRRAIVWTLQFTLKTNFYGPTSNQGYITKAIANIYEDKSMSNLNGKITITTNPANVVKGNTFTFVETFEGLD